MSADVQAGDLALVVGEHCPSGHIGLICEVISNPFEDARVCKRCGKLEVARFSECSLGGKRKVVLTKNLRPLRPRGEVYEEAAPQEAGLTA